jgi:hypothetical protein
MKEKSEKRRKFRRNLFINKLISVVLELLDEETEETSILGMITDTSKNGVQLTISQELAPATKVKIQISVGPTEDDYKTKEFPGIVRWCRPNELAESTYDVGIEIKQ